MEWFLRVAAFMVMISITVPMADLLMGIVGDEMSRLIHPEIPTASQPGRGGRYTGGGF